MLVAIYGTRNDQRLDFRQIMKLFSDPDESVARRRLLDIVGRLNIELPAEDAQAVVLEAAHEAGANLHGLHPKRSSLEDTFMAAIQRQRQG